MKYLFLLEISVLVMCLSLYANGAMTEKQLTAAVRLVRNMCQPKTKATNEDIEKMHNGDWNVDRTAMCYMYCALSSNKLITKENTFNYETAIAMAQKNLPVSFKQGTLESIEMCKDAAKTLDDKCVAAYELSKCVYEANPEIYFLP